MRMLCGNTNRFAPKAFSSLPFGSNSRTGGRLEPAQVFTPQRSAIQMWPLGATSTELVEPIVRPGGRVNQCSTVRYGLGWELGWAETKAATKLVSKRCLKAAAFIFRTPVF